MRHSVLQPALACPESASSSRCLITPTYFPPPDSAGRTQKESFMKSLMFGGNFSQTINTRSDFQDYLFLLSLPVKSHLYHLFLLSANPLL